LALGKQGEYWAKIEKGEFTKGPGPSIKEDTWKMVDVS
jgi:hypothetical protein